MPLLQHARASQLTLAAAPQCQSLEAGDPTGLAAAEAAAAAAAGVQWQAGLSGAPGAHCWAPWQGCPAAWLPPPAHHAYTLPHADAAAEEALYVVGAQQPTGLLMHSLRPAGCTLAPLLSLCHLPIQLASVLCGSTHSHAEQAALKPGDLACN